ncbi:MAG: hypothetical protein Q7Q73_10655 [Verrucomicrobiota bacterium JB024]|nr:hypothetical protein [Verrucomicrobiota bacterium JB024]
MSARRHKLSEVQLLFVFCVLVAAFGAVSIYFLRVYLEATAPDPGPVNIEYTDYDFDRKGNSTWWGFRCTSPTFKGELRLVAKSEGEDQILFSLPIVVTDASTVNIRILQDWEKTYDAPAKYMLDVSWEPADSNGQARDQGEADIRGRSYTCLMPKFSELSNYSYSVWLENTYYRLWTFESIGQGEEQSPESNLLLELRLYPDEALINAWEERESEAF